MDRASDNFLKQVFDECKHSRHFDDLSAIKFDWWPLIMVACRHYRLPPPLHFFQKFYVAPGDSGIADSIEGP